MRKATFLAMALVCGVAFTNCAAKKSAAKQQVVETKSETDQEIERLKKELELKKLQKEIELEETRMDAEIEAERLRLRNAQYSQAMQLGQKVAIPCIQESYDKHGEYMAGLGIAQGQPEIGTGNIQANRNALANIASRFMGVIKNGVSQYAKDVNTRNGQKIKESELEGEATAIGEKAINKYAEIVCYGDPELDVHGATYTCYVAVHVPIKKVLDDVINEQDVLTVDADRARWREFMQKELDSQAATKEAEKKELERLKEELK